ncbi:MAG: HEAT repeat domain-containing protein [Deltaproteobacteria bacterium]|nr:HEAT repeat domain-containing protein [Deltaproteobacteria bacterium]
MKKEISTLRASKDAVAKGYAAIRLGGMGERAKGAIGALIETLRDNTHLQWMPNGGSTSPRDEAARALGRIGKPAVEPLIDFIAALKDTDYGVRRGAAKALGTITGKNFGEDQQKWRDWLEGQKGKRH